MKRISYLAMHMTFGLLLAGLEHPAQSATTHGVDMINTSFNPSTITIQSGDSVQWTMRDQFTQHTSTSGTPPFTPNGLWDSGLLSTGQTFTHTFNQAGTFTYYCQPHAFTMSGSVTVQGGANQAPVVTIISPTNNESIPVTNMISIAATATDDGSIAQVQFFDGSNLIGTDSTPPPPYAVLANLSVGGHALTAVATDNLGLSSTSAVVNVTVRAVPLTDPIPQKIAKGTIAIEVQTVVDGLASPLGMAMPDDGTKRMFVYEQVGLIWVVRQGTKLATPMLDIRNRLVLLGPYDERGLLGVAVHPNFAQHPLIYTYSSEPNNGTADFPSTLPAGATNDHQSVIAEWRLDAVNTNQIAVASRREVLRIDEPQSNHNAGAMHFGPDGFLYVSLGDGGQADDEGNGHSAGGNGQDITTILGKLIRIDVDGTNSANGHYGVPVDNPFVNAAGVDEIYAYGFRNPYRFTFDRTGGSLYVGDVGQNAVEEVDIVTKGGNYGWRFKEGSFFFDPNGASAGYVTDVPIVPVPPGLVDPIAQYDHDEGLAVVGGYVYRGSAISALAGRYVMADWGNFSVPSARLFYLDAANVVTEFRLGLDDRPLGLWVKGFGEDDSGEIYIFASRVLGPAGNTGKMLKIIPAPEPLSIGSIDDLGNDVGITWTGGLGPYALQKKPQLSDTIWADHRFSSARSNTAPIVAQTGFFRTADAAHQGTIPFTAWMSGLMERPTQLTNTATGSGTFLLEDNTLYFEVKYGGLSGVATAAHIHGPASVAEPANVLINLQSFNGGSFSTSGVLSGSVLLTPEQKAMVLAGRTYVNVHTALNQGGEVRGQIAPVLMQADLNGANERLTPIDTPATGLGTLTLYGNQLAMNVTYSGLKAAASAAHIHGPAGTEAPANVMVDLSSLNGGAFGTNGSFAGTVTLTPAQLAAVIDGLTYINVHTSVNSSGEIRGQLLPQSTAIPFTAWMSGLMERPTPLTNSATGSGTFSLEGNTLIFNVKYAGLSGTATAAHIHGPASAAAPAVVLINLAPFNGGAFGVSGTLSGRVTVTPAQRAMILAGLTYVNVHTAINQGGELRGQIAQVGWRSSLSGINERPSSIASPGFGSGALVLIGNKVSMNVTYSSLTGTATASHIHGPAGVFAGANVMVNLQSINGGAYGVSGALAGEVMLTADQLAAFVDELTYLNFHTGVNSGGEIRGQITR
jgi:glucose/arabinose dehydrogenase/plastocyanin